MSEANNPERDESSGFLTFGEGKQVSPEARKTLEHMLCTVANLHAVMMHLAAPRVLAKLDPAEMAKVTPAQMVGLLDDFLAPWRDENPQEVAAGTEPPASVKLALKARRLLETWQFSSPAPPEIVQVAREIVAMLSPSSDPPDEGWDLWEGNADEDTPEKAP